MSINPIEQQLRNARASEMSAYQALEATIEKLKIENQRIILHAALDVLQGDPHQWSTRPCLTCRTISGLAGRPFGCSLVAAQAAGAEKTP